MGLESVTISIINFNGGDILGKMLSSIKRLNYPQLNIIIIDDGSTDSSAALAKKAHPDVRICDMGRNTKKINMLRNVGIKEAATDLVLVTDNDIIFEPDCLKTMVDVLRSSDDIALCTPRLMYLDEPERVYTDASQLHYVGTSISKFRGTVTDMKDRPPEQTAGCGIFLVDRKKAFEIGLFDEDYALGWGNDGEFYYRLKIAGYKALYIPQAVALHEAKEWGSSRHFRAYGQVRNRWHFLLNTYQLKTLILIIPALIMYEIFLLSFLTMKGMPHFYFKGNMSVIRHLNKILQKRKIVQATRKIPDSEILTTGNIYVSPALMNNPVLKIGIRLLNGFFNGYWKIIKRWI